MRVGQALALRYQHIDLSQLGNDFLRLVALTRHKNCLSLTAPGEGPSLYILGCGTIRM